MPVAWAAAIGAVGSIAGAAISSSSASSSADKQIAAQQQAMQQASAEREKYFGVGKDQLLPYAQLGTEQLPTIRTLLGQGEGGSDAMQAMLEKYPGYQFAIKQGDQGVINASLGQGGRESGNFYKAIADYNRGMGAGLYQQFFNNVTGVANQGANAGTGIANLAAGVGTGNANSAQTGYTNIGNAGAAGTIGQSNAWTNAIDQMVKGTSKMNLGNIGDTFGGSSAAATDGSQTWGVY